MNHSSERLIASVKLANEYQDSKIYFLGGDGNLVKNSVDESYVALGFYKDVGFDFSVVKNFQLFNIFFKEILGILALKILI